MSSLVEIVVETFQPRTGAKGPNLTLDALPALITVTNAGSLTQILINLLEKAITYADLGRLHCRSPFARKSSAHHQ